VARIRSVKPEFFRHEELQDLEAKHAGKYPMFVYEALWNQCDRQGVFLWRPRTLKLDILPFLPFEMEDTLKILSDAGYIKRYTVDGKDYGIIPTFAKHQSISKAEQDNKNLYPLPSADIETDDKPFENGLETDDEQSENGLETDDEQSENGCKTPEFGNRNSEFGNLNSAFGQSDGAFAPETDFSNDPKKLFLHLWQKTADVFNCTARIESPKEFDAFWEKSNITCDQVRAAIENFSADVRSGAIDRYFIPAMPDRFVLKGWIQKSQTRRPLKNAPPGTAPPSPGRAKKSL
jgi:hypothetical protein